MGSFYLFRENGTNKYSYFTYTQLSATFSHPGYFAAFVGFSIFITLGDVFQTIKRKKIYQLISLAFLFIMVVLLQGRINILAMAGALLVMLFLFCMAIIELTISRF